LRLGGTDNLITIPWLVTVCNSLRIIPLPSYLSIMSVVDMAYLIYIARGRAIAD
jgi:hypothetical protein